MKPSIKPGNFCSCTPRHRPPKKSTRRNSWSWSGRSSNRGAVPGFYQRTTVNYGILCDKTRIGHLKHHELCKDLCRELIHLGQMEDTWIPSSFQRMKEVKVHQQVAVPHAILNFTIFQNEMLHCDHSVFVQLRDARRGLRTSFYSTVLEVPIVKRFLTACNWSQYSQVARIHWNQQIYLINMEGEHSWTDGWAGGWVSLAAFPVRNVVRWLERVGIWLEPWAVLLKFWTSLTLFGYIHVSFATFCHFSHAWHSSGWQLYHKSNIKQHMANYGWLLKMKTGAKS